MRRVGPGGRDPAVLPVFSKVSLGRDMLPLQVRPLVLSAWNLPSQPGWLGRNNRRSEHGPQESRQTRQDEREQGQPGL